MATKQSVCWLPKLGNTMFSPKHSHCQHPYLEACLPWDPQRELCHHRCQSMVDRGCPTAHTTMSLHHSSTDLHHHRAHHSLLHHPDYLPDHPHHRLDMEAHKALCHRASIHPLRRRALGHPLRAQCLPDLARRPAFLNKLVCHQACLLGFSRATYGDKGLNHIINK